MIRTEREQEGRVHVYVTPFLSPLTDVSSLFFVDVQSALCSTISST